MEDVFTITEKELKKYYNLNKQKKEIDQELNHLKKLFHQALDKETGQNQKAEIECGQFKLQRQIRQTVSYRNDETIKKLIALNLEDFIKIERRPDKEKLEAGIKLGLVDAKEFEDYKQTRITQALIVKEK